VRKSLVLALVLVLGVSSASLAFTPTFSGKFAVKAVSEESFTGPFKIGPVARVDMDVAESNEVWSLDARIRVGWDPHKLDDDVSDGVSVNRYKGVLRLGNVSITGARNFDLDEISTPFAWIKQAKNPEDKNEKKLDQLRLNANVSGVAIDVQAVANAPTAASDSDIKARVQTEVHGVTVGGGLRFVEVSGTEHTDYVVYTKIPMGQFTLSAIYGSLPSELSGDDGQYAAELMWKPNNNIETAVGYSSADAGDVKDGVFARLQVTQGLVQGKVDYKQDKSTPEDKNVIEATFKYRGSDNNQSFSDLFKDWDETETDEYEDDENWYTNVAPAFGVYAKTQRDEETRIDVYGIAPFAGNAIARARVMTQGGDTGFDVEARFGLTEKLVLNPFVSNPLKDTTDDTTFGARAIYSVAQNAKFTVEASQTGEDQKLSAEVSIEF